MASFDYDSDDAACAQQQLEEAQRWDEEQRTLWADHGYGEWLAGMDRGAFTVAVDEAVSVADFARSLARAGLALCFRGDGRLYIVPVLRIAKTEDGRLPAVPF